MGIRVSTALPQVQYFVTYAQTPIGLGRPDQDAKLARLQDQLARQRARRLLPTTPIVHYEKARLHPHTHGPWVWLDCTVAASVRASVSAA
jgi:hypothetical protein